MSTWMHGRSRSRCRLWRWPWRLEPGGSGVPPNTCRRGAKPSLTRFPSTAFLRLRTRQQLTNWIRVSARTSSNQARLTKSGFLLARTRAVLLPFVRLVVSLDLAETQHRPRHSGVCPKARGSQHRRSRSKCKSVGRHCCACAHESPLSSLAASAPRGCRQTTRQRSTLLQETCVPTPCPPTKSRKSLDSTTFFLGGRLVPTHMQAQETFHEFTTFVKCSSSLSFFQNGSDDAGRTVV